MNAMLQSSDGFFLLKSIMSLDFLLSLSVIYYMLNPAVTEAEFGLASLQGEAKSASRLMIRCFYGKSLIHSFCMLAAILCTDRTFVVLVAVCTLCWCLFMPLLIYLHVGTSKPQTKLLCRSLLAFAFMYGVSIALLVMDVAVDIGFEQVLSWSRELIQDKRTLRVLTTLCRGALLAKFLYSFVRFFVMTGEQASAIAQSPNSTTSKQFILYYMRMATLYDAAIAFVAMISRDNLTAFLYLALSYLYDVLVSHGCSQEMALYAQRQE